MDTRELHRIRYTGDEDGALRLTELEIHTVPLSPDNPWTAAMGPTL